MGYPSRSWGSEMAVVISEIITETAVAPSGASGIAQAQDVTAVDLEVVVRRAAERVLEILRREWDR